MHAMEIEIPGENVAQSLIEYAFPPEIQRGITYYLEDELLTPKNIAKWNTGSTGVMGLAYDPSGRSLATGRFDGMVDIRSTENGTPIKAWNTGSPVRALVYSPDGEQIAIGHNDRVQIGSKDLTLIREWETLAPVSALKFSHDGNSLTTGDFNAIAQLRSTKDGTLKTEWRTLGKVWAIGDHPDGPSVATGESNGDMFIVINDATKRDRCSCSWCSYSISAFAFGPNSNFYAIGYEREEVEIRSITDSSRAIAKWVTRTEKDIERQRWDIYNVPRVLALAFDPNGHTLATGHNDDMMQIWNILPVLAAHACKNKKLTFRHLLMLKELHHNTTNKPLYLNAGGRYIFDSLRGTGDGAERNPGIDDFYTLQKPKFNDTETDETKKRWRIVPKTFDPNNLEEHGGKDEKE